MELRGEIIFGHRMSNRVSIIDLGTNTFHLLIADKTTHLYEERRPVRIGMGGINRNTITPEALERAVQCLKDYRQKSDEFGVEKLMAIGTSALRNAENVKHVTETIYKETGIEVTVISGDQEAALIYDGIRSGMNLGEDYSIIVDIGGGSVEFIIANQQKLLWKISLETGGQRLIERFQKNDPILAAEIFAVEEHLSEQLSEVLKAIESYRPQVLVGSSGSFETLSEIWCLKNDLIYQPGPETPLTLEGFQSVARELIALDRAGRMKVPGMIELRVDMIVVAIVLIRFLIDRSGISQLRVSGYSLKEGVQWRIRNGLSV